jgi:hypothetical protein
VDIISRARCVIGTISPYATVVDVIITKYKWSTNVLALDISSWRKKYVIIENAITTKNNNKTLFICRI